MYMTERSLQPSFDPNLERSNIIDSQAFGHIIELLESPSLTDEALKGNVTLAMVRPNAGPSANLMGMSDAECSDKIETMISGLGFITKFSFTFDERALNDFYGGAPQEVMERNPARDQIAYESRWPEFKKDMSSGPSTAILLYSPNGDAVELWRKHLGHWNINKFRDPETIRGALAVDVFNNLVHGSDAPESVARELKILHDLLLRKS